MSELYTTSSNKCYCSKILNKIKQEHPEYESIITFLNGFALQRWASENRALLGLGLNSLEDAIISESEYFGLKIQGNGLNYQKESLLITKKILSVLAKGVCDKKNFSIKELDIFNEIFFFSTTHCVTKYDITSNFEKIILKLCELHYQECDKLKKELDDISSKLDEEIAVAYHNTEILFLVSSLLGIERKYMFDIDSKELCNIIYCAVKSLENYPFDDGVDWVTIGRFKGKSPSRLSLTSGRHNDYIKKRYEEGLDALDAIFWGYTNKS